MILTWYNNYCYLLGMQLNYTSNLKSETLHDIYDSKSSFAFVLNVPSAKYNQSNFISPFIAVSLFARIFLTF